MVNGDNRPNRMEIDMSADVRRNDDLNIKFKARWVRGNPRLIAWDMGLKASLAVF